MVETLAFILGLSTYVHASSVCLTPKWFDTTSCEAHWKDPGSRLDRTILECIEAADPDACVVRILEPCGSIWERCC